MEEDMSNTTSCRQNMVSRTSRLRQVWLPYNHQNGYSNSNLSCSKKISDKCKEYFVFIREDFKSTFQEKRRKFCQAQDFSLVTLLCLFHSNSNADQSKKMIDFVSINRDMLVNPIPSIYTLTTISSFFH